VNKKRVQPLKRSIKDIDDLFNDCGGIFDRPAKVNFKEPQRKTPRITIPGVKSPQVLTKKDQERIKKLEAIIKDPGASEAEKETARAKINKIKGV